MGEKAKGKAVEQVGGGGGEQQLTANYHHRREVDRTARPRIERTTTRQPGAQTSPRKEESSSTNNRQNIEVCPYIHIHMYTIHIHTGCLKKTLFRDFWPLKLNKNG